ALHDLRALHNALVSGAPERLFHPRHAFLVKLVKADALGARRRKQLDGNGNQSEGEIAFPNRRCHGISLEVRKSKFVLAVAPGSKLTHSIFQFEDRNSKLVPAAFCLLPSAYCPPDGGFVPHFSRAR